MTSWADNAVKSCFPSDLKQEVRCHDLEHHAFQKDFPGRYGFKVMFRGGGGAKPAPRDLLADAFG